MKLSFSLFFLKIIYLYYNVKPKLFWLLVDFLNLWHISFWTFTILHIIIIIIINFILFFNFHWFLLLLLLILFYFLTFIDFYSLPDYHFLSPTRLFKYSSLQLSFSHIILFLLPLLYVYLYLYTPLCSVFLNSFSLGILKNFPFSPAIYTWRTAPSPLPLSTIIKYWNEQGCIDALFY